MSATSDSSRPNTLAVVPLLVLGLIVGAVAVGGFALARQDAPTDEKTADADPEKSDDGKRPENPFPDTIRVPDGILDGGTGWLNTAGPIRMKDLRGKVVILDFWTYCCINCIHVLPDLKYLEEKYPNELVVIGVHSAKFDNEKESGNIRRAIQRYEIAHPVINDSRMLVWRKFGARAWPTLAVVDPEGKFLGSISGEGHRELLDTIVGKLVDYHDEIGTLDRSPVRFDLEAAKLEPTPLKFPGKVLADEKGGRLIVADTNHNRIVVSSLDGGTLIDVIGSGTIGWKDGGFAEARFDHPQGIAIVGDMLYVADTENHLIRTVDLARKTVKTLAGSGKQDQSRTTGGKPLEIDLNSPWCLTVEDGVLYIGMAGPHQIWSHEIGSDRIGVFAGNGREDVVDGPHDDSSFAQPSGIVSDGKYLYICDSEGSSIRSVPLDTTDEEVGTIVGEHDLPRGATLFEFGDADGTGTDVRLQHPIGIAYRDDTLYVADSYNHKIKKLTPEVKDGKRTGLWKSETWLGTGEPGEKLTELAEPHGLTIAGGKLIVADTNNSRLLAVDLKTKEVAELTIAGLKPPVIEETPDDDGDDVFADGKPFVGVGEQVVGTDGSLDFRIDLAVPRGFKWNDKFPVKYRLRADGDQPLVAASNLDKRTSAKVEDGIATISVPLAAKTGKGSYQLAVTYGYCSEGGGICKLATARFRLPVNVTADGARKPIALEAPPVFEPRPEEDPAEDEAKGDATTDDATKDE